MIAAYDHTLAFMLINNIFKNLDAEDIGGRLYPKNQNSITDTVPTAVKHDTIQQQSHQANLKYRIAQLQLHSIKSVRCKHPFKDILQLKARHPRVRIHLHKNLHFWKEPGVLGLKHVLTHDNKVMMKTHQQGE